MPPAPAATQTPAPAVTPLGTPVAAPQEVSPAVTNAAQLPVKTSATVKTFETLTGSEKVILNTQGSILPTEYKIYDFKAMGDEFSKVGEKYRITLKADKPVIGYAVTRTQADELQGSQLIPRYDSSSDKIQWGLITPYMVLGRVTEETKTFTVETVNPYVYVVDARWMGFEPAYKTTSPFNYELTITKIISPSDPNGATART
jgi:hypothetical protein